MFFWFANFYYCFIQHFSKIAIPLILILKTIKLLDWSASIYIKININKVVDNDNNSLKLILSKSEKINITKSKNLVKSKNSINFFNPRI